MEFTDDLKKLAHNRKAVAGAIGAAALGAFVYLRNRKAGTSATDSGTASAAGTGSVAGMGGGVDTTGTDIASWLGQYGGSLQNQLDAYQQQLTSALAGIPVPSTPTTAGSNQYLVTSGDASKGKDTLYTIAHNLGFSGLFLHYANPSAGYSPAAGTLLNVPGSISYTVTGADASKGKDTLFTIAHKFGISGNVLRKADPNAGYSPKAGTVLTIPVPGH